MNPLLSIDPTVLIKIQDKLDAIELKFGVDILYACESGSRGWGFHSPNSDYDVRFIYVHKPEWYFRISTTRDTIDQHDIKIIDELDFEGWDLRKVVSLINKGNATLIEWLNSPIVYRYDQTFVSDVGNVITETFKPERSFYHYLHMARGCYKECGVGETVSVKIYLYTLRTVFAALWVDHGLGPAPMSFADLINGVLEIDNNLKYLKPDIDKLLLLKMSTNESGFINRNPVFEDFFTDVIGRLGGVKMGSTPDDKIFMLDNLISKHILSAR
jgi:predicted nucleotidyltransferase